MEIDDCDQTTRWVTSMVGFYVSRVAMYDLRRRVATNHGKGLGEVMGFGYSKYYVTSDFA